MGSALCNLEEEFFQVVLSHWGSKYITPEVCQLLRLVSRGACQAVANTRPRVHITICPTRGVLLAWQRRGHVVNKFANIVRVDVMPHYTKSIDDVALCQVLQACGALEHLKLRSTCWTGRALARVLAAANTHQTLKHVDLTGAAPGTQGCDSLLPVLPGLGNLRVLSLAQNSLYAVASEKLGQLLRLCPLLEDLDLSANGLTDANGAEVCKVLKGVPALERLDLAVNFLGHRSADRVGELMVCSKSLRHLDLSNNQMRDVGASKVASRLGRTACLETLVLSGNGVQDSGAEALAVGLRKSTTLRCLDVTRNEIGVGWAMALNRGMKNAHGRTCRVLVDDNKRTVCTRLPLHADRLLWTGIEDLRHDDGVFEYVFSTPGRESVDART